MSNRVNRTFDSFTKRDDTRRERAKYTQDLPANQQDLYNSFINLIVNHKMELQKIPAASHPETAADWAEKRGLRAGQQDFDNDGHPETVIYNKAGNPYIINGYKLKPSDYPIRNQYWGANKTKADRIEAGPMREWITDQAYKVDIPDPKRFWNRNVSTTDFGHQLKRWGYKMPTKPKKQLSVFQDFCKRIAPYVKDYFEGWTEEGDNVPALEKLLRRDPNDVDSINEYNAKFLKKILSPITIYRMLYLKIVERYYFFELINLGILLKNENSYENYKKYCKQHPDDLWDFYTNKLLIRNSNGSISFKDNIVNMSVISRLFVKDRIDWDLTDEDDAIAFLISKKNIEDQDFMNTLQYKENAEAFFEQLEGNDKRMKNGRRKELEKWKENARKGTKDFFENQIKWLFLHNGALERFEAAKEMRVNPVDPNPEVAEPVSQIDESQQNTTQVELSEVEEDEN